MFITPWLVGPSSRVPGPSLAAEKYSLRKNETERKEGTKEGGGARKEVRKEGRGRRDYEKELFLGASIWRHLYKTDPISPSAPSILAVPPLTKAMACPGSYRQLGQRKEL